MAVQVYKFGGASIKDAESIKNVGNIILQQEYDKLVIVVSALGKTTNALEKVVDSYFKQDGKTSDIAESIKEDHYQIIEDLFSNDENKNSIKEKIHNLFVELQWVIEDEPKDSYEYIYDQIVSVGELASSNLVANYLNSKDLALEWLDARDFIKTDNTFKEAYINWDTTKTKINDVVLPALQNGPILTQGFIGSTSDNDSTTLGREGSDYTAAILSYCLDAEQQVIWKDVDGVLNADPNAFEDTRLIDDLSYGEAVEMTYYGAKVIHPKTIKPLQNKRIPLVVRSFKNTEKTGTKIHADGLNKVELPVIIKKTNQVLLSFITKDFSFTDENQIGEIMSVFGKHNIKINLIQTGAIRFSALVDEKTAHIVQIEKELSDKFDIKIRRNISLLTIRHYDDATIEKYTSREEVLLEQKTAINYQAVLA